MTRAAAKLAVALMTVALPATAVSCRQAPVPPLPSIVLVTIDTMRADHLGTYGYFRDTSPAIDRFARDAVVFENVITPMATTLPAHVSLMTSTHTITHGIKGNFAHLGTQFRGAAGRAAAGSGGGRGGGGGEAVVAGGEAESAGRDRAGIVTLAEILRGMGYGTAAFVSAAPLKNHTGIQTGFDDYDQPQGRDRLGEETVDRALEWMAARPPGPVFLWVHLWDPHAPYEPPAAFAGTFEMEPGLEEFLTARGVDAADRRVARWNNDYDASVRYTDAQIERLFAALRAEGLWTESAVVVTGDHGEGLGQHGWRDHGRIFNEQLFVPLIIKFPDASAVNGRRLDGLASLLDVVPTLVGQLRLPVDDRQRSQFEGLDLLDAAVDARTYVFAERSHRDRDWEGGLRYALLGSGWKYFHETDGPDELYDLTVDRTEQRNAIEQNPAIARRMRRVIDSLLAAEVLYEQGEIPAERIEQLRALGYIR